MTTVMRELVIRERIETFLEDISSHIYYENAPEGTPYPYVTYTLSDSIDDGSVEDLELELDGYYLSENGESTPLVELIGNIDNKLHRSVHRAEGVFFTVYRENRRTIRESDKRLKRRQMIYQLRVMGEGM